MTLLELKDARLTLDNRVAVLTFQRHDVRNALTGTALVDDLVVFFLRDQTARGHECEQRHECDSDTSHKWCLR